MKKLRWYFKGGTTFEEYTALYEDESFILVQNDKTGKYSFGLSRDFGSLFGFPVSWSCLDLKKLKKVLSGLIRVDKRFIGKTAGQAERGIERWQAMLSALKEATA